MNFKDWNPESKATYQVNRDTCRDVFVTPNGVDLYDHWVSPWNVFKPAYGYTVCGLTIPVGALDLVRGYGGDITENWYTDEGYCLAIFCGENCLEKAYNFAMNEKDKFIDCWKKKL